MADAERAKRQQIRGIDQKKQFSRMLDRRAAVNFSNVVDPCKSIFVYTKPFFGDLTKK